MKILIVACIDPSLPLKGGTATYSRNLLEYLSKTGNEVNLLGFCHSDSSLTNNKFALIPVAHKTRITGYEYFLRLMVKAPFIRIPASAIIHVQRPEYTLAFVLCHRKNPKIVTLHGKALENIKLKRKKTVRLIYKMAEYLALKYSDMIIVVDEATVKFYQHEYPRLAAKIRIIPTGIDLSKFRLLDRDSLRRKYGFKPDDKVIVYVGRLEKEKNIDFLINSFSLLLESVREATLIIVGDGRDRERLEDLVNSLGLKRVIFMGVQEPDKIPEILNCADVLALCSFFEGSPTVVKEALACGSPVVSTDVGDVSQIIRGETIGRIVSRNQEDFVRALADVLVKEDREKVRVECARAATEFGFDQIGAKTVELYKELLLTEGENV